MDVAQADIFNDGSGYAADDGRIARVGVEHVDVANEDALHAAHGCPLRTAHTCAQAKEDGGVDDVAHGDVADNNVFQSDAPDERVLPVAVAEILVAVVFVGFRFVIAFGSCGEGGCNHGALFHLQMDVAGQSDGVAGIVASGQVDGTSAIGGCFLDGTVDSGAVYSLSVGFGTVAFYIIYVGLDCCRAEAEQQEQYLFHHCRGIKVNRFK